MQAGEGAAPSLAHKAWQFQGLGAQDAAAPGQSTAGTRPRASSASGPAPAPRHPADPGETQETQPNNSVCPQGTAETMARAPGSAAAVPCRHTCTGPHASQSKKKKSLSAPRSLSSLTVIHSCPSSLRGLSKVRREGGTPHHTRLTKLKGSRCRGDRSRPPTVLQAPL